MAGGVEAVSASAGSVTDFIYDELTARLRTGRFRAGERLVEARLTAELGVSRVPLREVLRRLATEGAIEISPNRGASVRVLSRSQLAELFQVRLAIEGLGASLAARRINEPGVRDAIHLLLEHACPSDEVDITIDNSSGHRHTTTEAEIHRGIVEQSANGLLLTHWKMLEFPIHRLRYQGYVGSEQRRRSQADHERVLRAILAGDEERARQTMVEHVERIADNIQQLRDREFHDVVNPGLLDAQLGT